MSTKILIALQNFDPLGFDCRNRLSGIVFLFRLDDPTDQSFGTVYPLVDGQNRREKRERERIEKEGKSTIEEK